MYVAARVSLCEKGLLYYKCSYSIASPVLIHTPIDITGALGGTSEESTSEYVSGLILKVMGLAMSTLARMEPSASLDVSDPL